MFKKNPLAYTIGCVLAASTLGLANPALAQDQDEPTELNENEVEEVIVTGSRIKRDAFTASTPMDVINTEVSSIQGIADVGDLLTSTTVAAGSAQVTPFTSSAVTLGGLGSATLSLRGLGANRTLTLLNGRRAGPAGTRGGVSSFDLNVLPLSAIERVEILKDGASSIYGSDAVAGVVNIITKKGDGGTVDAYVGIPEHGGGEETRFSASWGKAWDRGNFRITADYHKIEELKMGDRDYLSCGEMYIFDPDTGERADAYDPRRPGYACQDLIWGHVWIYDYQEYYQDFTNVPFAAKAQYDYDGDLGQYVPGFEDPDPDSPYSMRTPPDWYPVAYDKNSDGVTNYDHPFQDETSLYPEMERATIFATGEFTLSENMDLYAEVLLNRRETKANGYRQFWGYIFNYDYIPWWADGDGSIVPGQGNVLSEGWTGAQWLSPTPITNEGSDEEIKVDYQRYVLGATGDFGNDWIWDVSYQYSKSDGDYTEDQIYDDSVQANNELHGSCVGTVTAVRGVPCMDIPWLDPAFLNGEYSPELRDFLFTTETGNTEYTQWSVEGYVSGEWFEMPAGGMGVALGVHYREDEIVDTPADIILASNAWGSTAAGITTGSDTTKAVFGEVDVPLLANRPGFEYMALNASARWTDVDSYGDDWTYKVGLNWQITQSIRFRANQGTSFRAPALYELYLADQTSFWNQRSIDPCIRWGSELDAGNISQRTADHCAATTTPQFPDGLPTDFTGGTITATVYTGGGLGVLEAETSTSQTAGLVWTPGFANLSISLDYFNIEVNDQVDQLGADGIVYGCYDSEFYPEDPLCSLFDRTGLNAGIDNVRDSFINVAEQTNSGYDFALKWVTDIGPGSFNLDTQFTYQEEAITALFDDTVRDENGEFGEPEVVGRIWMTYDWNDWSFFWGANYIGEVSNEDSHGGNTSTYRGQTVRIVIDADAVWYNNFSVTKFFMDGELKTTLGIRNAFDEEPPRTSTIGHGEFGTVGYGPVLSQYDYLGRRFFFNVTWNF